MDNRSTDRLEDYPSVETPEDVAVLYSWANLHGAKYRDFSASRREYRAQLRHRAAEQAREQELQAQAEAEAAAFEAEQATRHAQHLAYLHAEEAEQERQLALQHAEEAARVAAAERLEAARRAEAAAHAEAEANRERREIAEANAAARRQASQYTESDSRRNYAAEYSEDAELPGRISDPYTPSSRAALPPVVETAEPSPANDVVELHPTRYRVAPERERDQTMEYEQEMQPERAQEHWQDRVREAAAPPPSRPVSEARRGSQPAVSAASRRPQGFRPDDASGVREIYRGPASQPPRPPSQGASRNGSSAGRSVANGAASSLAATPARSADLTHRRTIWAGSPEDRSGARASNASRSREVPAAAPAIEAPRRRRTDFLPDNRIDSGSGPAATPRERRQTAPSREPARAQARDNGGQSWNGDDSSRGASALPSPRREERAPQPAEPVGPAWIFEPRDGQSSASMPAAAAIPQSSVADTLQHSRERVASRWYALKGVFEQPGQPSPEPEPVRQKETRTPVLAVFSLAGGVGKTSLVATLGRALSSLGEKALLTDTTSHGLLPFYFGASELRQGTVRTFSPPSGSTDAPINLVSYDVDARNDAESQEALVEEITEGGRGMQRILLDLSVHSAWLLRRMAHLSPTVLVPVAPDMSSVISLGGVEKFLRGVTDAEGAPAKVFYVLNHFDASLPLHLDVREVLRRQLGDKLLPFVIRRAPMVSEALAEGMTIIDYSPETPVAEDYLTIATWLRSHAAPATTGFRTVRWSER